MANGPAIPYHHRTLYEEGAAKMRERIRKRRGRMWQVRFEYKSWSTTEGVVDAT